MKRMPIVIVGLGVALVASFSQMAHAQFTGSVTTAPLGFASLGVPLVSGTGAVLLVALLGIAGLYGLRQSRRLQQPIVGLALAVAILFSVTGVVAAFVNVVVSGEDCNRSFTGLFALDAGGLELISDCPNPIRITDMTDCDPAATSEELRDNIGPCEVGTVLENGQSCTLPSCDE